MLKGINKQIIEIRCTDDEFFEKALLFVRSDKADLPHSVFAEHSEELFGGAGPRSPEKKRTKRTLTPAIAMLLLSSLLLLTAVVYVCASLA